MYEQTARPGSRAPHCWLADGRSTLDLFGAGFVLLRFADAETAGIETAAADAGMPLETVDIRDADIAAAYDAALVLVRPDGHVAWRGDAPPGDAAAVIERVRGAA